MEPMRPLVDALVVEFLSRHTFNRVDFPIGRDGVCRLHPQLARAVAQVGTLRPEVFENETRLFANRIPATAKHDERPE
jgi:hypothetical protein